MSDYGYTYSADESYCWPGSRVLKNKLGLQDAEKLADAERHITYLRLVELQKQPVRGQYGFAHLRAIHRYIFGDLYDWAGEIRRGEFLMKGGTVFCRGQYIESYAKSVFDRLTAEKKLRGLPKEQFVQRMAWYMGEVNALHPFREGNGRTSREFFRQLAKSAGYSLDFGGVDKDALLRADIAAFEKEYAPLVAVLEVSVEKT